MNDIPTKDMNKAQALYWFFSQFMVAYEENSIYAGGIVSKFPYITYAVTLDNLNDTDTATQFSTWFRTTTWKDSNELTERISETIGREGFRIPFKDGYILIRRGQPFAQLMGDDSDDLIKRTMFNIMVRYYCNY